MSIRPLTAAAIIAASSIAATSASAQFYSDSFTYQGSLSENGAPANGFYDITFLVYDDELGGAPITNGTVTVTNVQVTDGLFSTEVDFGVFGDIFNTFTPRWIELRVSESGQPGTTILEPRQKLTPATLANFSLQSGYAVSSGTSLQDAYHNGNTIHFDNTNGPINLQEFSGNSPVINFNNALAQARLVLGSNSFEDAGFMVLGGALGNAIIRMENDFSTGGGGFFVLSRNDVGDSGVVMQGNVSGNENAALSIIGADRAMALNTNAAGDESVVVPNSAINATEMLNEPGVAETSNSGLTALTQASPTIDVIRSITIDAPSGGYVLVMATAEVSLGHFAGTTTSVNLGISANETSFFANTDHETRIPSTAPDGVYDYTVTVHALMSATAGANTYYFLGDLNNNAPVTCSILDQQVTALFVPTAYGPAALQLQSNLPDEYNQVSPPMSQLDILAERDAAIQANAARQQRELEEMRAVIQQLKEQIDEQDQRQSRD